MWYPESVAWEKEPGPQGPQTPPVVGTDGAAQIVQFEAPTPAVLPPLHSWQTPPPAEYVLTPHFKQAVCPLASALPEGHRVHAVLPRLRATIPTAHVGQMLATPVPPQ